MDGLSSSSPRGKGSDYKIGGDCVAKPCNVLLSYTKTVMKKLTSAVAQFWWSPGGTNRGIHWKSWDKLCSPKDEGGLGFKDLTDFNTSMLGKQL